MKTQTALRFDDDLLQLIKEKAKAQKRSLNNYIEYLLYRDVGDIPNDETLEAIDDAKNKNNVSKITDLKAYKNSLLKD